jgi:hypothetical protein
MKQKQILTCPHCEKEFLLEWNFKIEIEDVEVSYGDSL